ncbi:MAG TPA: hypothetical protein VFG03_04525 [Telluria sp.]|nr:hypothetical protein [Telluria sp.]
MKKTMVRYTVKPGRAAENEAYIAKVFEQLHRERPAALRYASFKLDDGVSFVHIVSQEGGGEDSLLGLPAFRAFIAGIRDRCEERPLSVELSEIGSYGIFGK